MHEGLAILVGVEAALIGVLHLATGGRWFRTCAYLLGVTAPLDLYRTTVAGFNVSLFRLSIGVVLTTIVVERIRTRSPLRSPRTAWLLASVYLLLAAVIGVSLLDAGDSYLGRRQLAGVVIGALVVVLAAELAARTSVRDLATAFVAGAVLPMLAACWQLLAPHLSADGALPLVERLPVAPGLDETQTARVTLGSAERVRGTIDDPNYFGIYLVFVAFIASALAVQARQQLRRQRAIALGVVAGASVAALVATYSRTAWAAGALGLVACLVSLARAGRRPVAPRRLVWAGATMTVMAALALVLAGPTLGARLSPSSPLREVSTRERLDKAAVGIRMFRSKPVAGIGAGQLGVVVGAPNPRVGSGADSTYVTIAAELGAVGLFVLLLGAGLALQLLWQGARRADGGRAGILAVALLGAYVGFIFANAVQDAWWREFHFVLLGLVAAMGARGDLFRRA